MSKFTDQQYLKSDQYCDATNLNVRLDIHHLFSTNHYGWFPWIFDTLETMPSPARVLELGCGPADMWAECSERIPSGWDITLSDLSEGMLAAARQNLADISNRFEFQEIDASFIPYPDETFDVIIANHMLYHVPDRPKALQEIHRVLIAGGYFIATTAGQAHLAEMNYWLNKTGPDKDFIPFNNPFTLDNGLEQLKPFFSTVEIKRYYDLRVTDIEPLMAYIFSTIKAREIPEFELAKIRQELEDILFEKGEIFITKDSGLFLAVKL